MVVARGAAGEGQPLRPQIHVCLVLKRRPVRLEGKGERPRADVPKRGALDVDLGPLSNRGIPSAEALDVAARSHLDRHLVPWALCRPDRVGKWTDGPQTSCGGAEREVDPIGRFRRVDRAPHLSQVDAGVDGAVTHQRVCDVGMEVADPAVDARRSVRENGAIASPHTKS